MFIDGTFVVESRFLSYEELKKIIYEKLNAQCVARVFLPTSKNRLAWSPSCEPQDLENMGT